MTRKYHSAKDYFDAAKSPETPPEELEYLAMSEYDFVRIGVAQNPNITAEILSALIPIKLETWNEQALAASLTENPKTPPDTLALLAEKLIPVLDHGRGNDNGFRAGVSLCCNPNTPFEAIKFVLQSDQVATALRRKVAATSRRQDVLNLLLTDKSEAVRKRAKNSLEFLHQS